MKIEKTLQQGILVRRYKRFLADIQTPGGETLTIHCPNTGSMKNCQQPGSRVWYTDSGNRQRKYPHTWQLVETRGGHRVGINTGLANDLVEEALRAGLIDPLAGFEKLRREVPYGEQRSRIDILLESPGQPPCYVEIKNVSLADEDGHGLFPDAVTSRGQKHLQELIHMQESGARAALVFCVQHTGVASVSPADDIDPEYGRLLRQAMAAGVSVFALGADIDLDVPSITLCRKLPVTT